ncbi:MAG: biopolymer transporter ExbD [Leptolyngbyaceae cyanobacterium CSU_1_4]|nr:biopolymer transporter ExbD [Leptolyngbyaceae cyanobacterium CSU_1_4]
MRLPQEPESPSQINIVPMIDVIFAILAFFIMSTLYLSRSEGLPVNLPGATTAQSQPQSQTVVTIDRSGNLALNRQPLELAVLEAQMRGLAANGQQPFVVINADQSVSHGRVVEVMDRLRKIEGVRMAIATQRP